LPRTGTDVAPVVLLLSGPTARAATAATGTT